MITRILTYFFLFIICVNAFNLSAQDQWCDLEQEEELIGMYNEACVMIEDSSTGAIPLLKRITKLDTSYVDPLFKLGEAFYWKAIRSQYDILLASHTAYYFKKSEDYFLQSIQLCESFSAYLAYWYLGELYYLQGEYSLANRYLSIYQLNGYGNEIAFEKSSIYIRNCNKWKHWHNQSSNVQIHALDEINTRFEEQKPYISDAANSLSFLKKKTVGKSNSIYTSQQAIFNKVYTQGVNTKGQSIFKNNLKIEHLIPETYKVYSYFFHPNTNSEYFSIQQIRSNGKVYDRDCDVYQEKSIDKQFVGVDTTINLSNYFDGEPTVSHDGKYMIFVSDRPGGFGGKDLYFSEKNTFGEWKEPVNLGETINSLNDERTPFLHFDQQTLYFSSDGTFGLGGFDVFISRRVNDSVWGTPMNLGLPFNSYYDDMNFTVDARGIMAYITSDKLSGKGGFDIYTIDLPDSIAPKKSLILNGKIIDESNRPAQNVEFALVDIETGMVVDFSFDTEKSAFSVILPNKSGNYLFRIRKEGYGFSDRIFSSQKSNLMNYRSIQIFPLIPGKVFELSELKFENNSADLKRSNAIVLNNLAQFIADNRGMSIKIYGYFDVNEKIKLNNNLSERRAKNVYDYLLQAGVDAKQLSYTGRFEAQSFKAKSPIEFEILDK